MISLLACESKAGRFNNPRDSYAYPLGAEFRAGRVGKFTHSNTQFQPTGMRIMEYRTADVVI